MNEDRFMTTFCMLTSKHSPFDDRIYYKEILSLAKRCSRIVIVAPENDGNTQIHEAGIEVVSLRKTDSLLSRVLVILQAIFTVVKFRPQICHFHDYELIFALPFLRILTRSKLIYDVHEVYPEMIEESKRFPRILRPFLSKLVDFLEKKLSRLAHYIITTDENISMRFTGISRNVCTIFNYPRLSMFIPDDNKVAQLRDHYEKRVPIIYVGGMDENKGLFQMIRAMEILKSRRPDIILLLVGPMNMNLQKRVNREIKERKIQDHIEIIGSVPHIDVVNYISVAKIGLIVNLPTKKWHKNIPIKQFEYMACGVPVLGANLPPIASYVTAAGCGRIFDSTSVEALASGVIEILHDDTEWKRMAEAGKRAVQCLWNWDKMEMRLFDVYGRLLRNDG